MDQTRLRVIDRVFLIRKVGNIARSVFSHLWLINKCYLVGTMGQPSTGLAQHLQLPEVKGKMVSLHQAMYIQELTGLTIES